MTSIKHSIDGKKIYIALATLVKTIFRIRKVPSTGKTRGKARLRKEVITDHITDISTKSADNLSNTSSYNLASVKAALLLTLAN